MNRRLYIFAYDIGDNKCRDRVRRLLKAYAVDGQKSVFECLLDVSELEYVCRAVKAVLGEGDRMVAALLPDKGEHLCLGRAKHLAFDPFLIV